MRNEVDTTELRKRLKLAFASLRTFGVFSRMNYQCCMSCAQAAMPKGYGRAAYYHQQDADSMKRTGEATIRFCVEEEGTFVPEELGRLVCQELMKAGLWVRWPHDADIVIDARLMD